MSKRFDLVVFGASRFTGRLLAEYLTRTCSAGGKLAEVRRAVDADET